MELTLPAQLAALARRMPEEPWLFYFSDLDWRWLSFAAIHAAVEEVAANLESELRASDIDPGRRVAFADHRSIASVVVDLALQRAGRVPLPVSPELAADPVVTSSEPGAWVELPLWPARDEAAGPGSPPPAWESLTRLKPGLETRGPARLAELSGSDLSPSLTCASAEGWTSVPVARVRAAAAEIDGLLRAVSQGRPRAGEQREISVLTQPLAAPLGRLQLAWSLRAGAALLLEPDAFSFAATVAWARPTVLFGSAARAEAVLRRLEGEGPARGFWKPWRKERPKGLPWGRLRAWVSPAEEPLPDPLRAAFDDRGVRLLTAPDLLAA